MIKMSFMKYLCDYSGVLQLSTVLLFLCMLLYVVAVPCLNTDLEVYCVLFCNIYIYIYIYILG